MLVIDRSGTLRESPLTESLQIRVYRKLDLGVPYEFVLWRGDFFAGRRCGLHAVGADEISYFDFQSRSVDVFEMPKLPAIEPIIKTCNGCHAHLDGLGGIHSVNTIYARSETGARPSGLRPTTLSQEVRTTIDWTQQSYSWGLLQGLWEPRSAE